MSLSSVHPISGSIAAAAQITVVYTGLYSVTILNQVVTKKRLHRKLGDKFDRYSSLEMRNVDRLTGNFLEWTIVFLGPLWSMALTDTLSDTSQLIAWTYVGLRLLYTGLSLKYGVNGQGNNKPLWISTFPSYVCLLYMLGAAIQGVF
ncbi:MAPEG family protein [Nitzschia inconspicua]|uniref:MAPEG family protein n=1 Tax=Nitzschia inconspicua TaxID=303405 RepID=A0A9K3PF24_9STRA|nr:MAPEG family protein [Nitzschia inconspicua]